MPLKSKSNTLAIKAKKKEFQASKEPKLKNSKSIAKAIKQENKKHCEGNTSAIPAKTKESSKSIAKVLPEQATADLRFPAKFKQNILEVANIAPELIEMLDWYRKKHKNVIETPELKINNKALGETIITKTFKISEKAVKKFIEFAEKHSQFKHQDLLGMALIEFVEKYHN
jgi:hypothetical protein